MTPPDLFERLIENSNVIGWDADPQTFQYNYVSPYAETLLGYPAERWKESGFWQSKIHPDDVDHAVGFCKASTEKLESHEFEYRMISSTGRHVWLRDIAAVESSNGLPTRLYGIMFDITRLRRKRCRPWHKPEMMPFRPTEPKLAFLQTLAMNFARR